MGADAQGAGYPPFAMTLVTPRVLGALLLATAAGCGSSNVGSSLRPREVTAAEALGGSTGAICTPSADDRTLIVDAPDEDRKAIEEMLRKNQVPVAKYDCRSLRVLERCKLVADFAYVGTALRDKTLRIESSDQAAATLPLASASVRAGFARGQKIDLALAEVGSRTASFELVVRSTLHGDRPQDCEGATHFIHKVDVGAFAFSQSTAGEATSAAQIFAAAASGESRSGRTSTRAEGKLESCRKAAESDANAPDQCAVPIRVHLRRIEEASAPAAASAPLPVVAQACPGDTVRSEGGVCVSASLPVRHVCRDDDLEDCETQCRSGNVESCVKQAHFFLYGAKSRGAPVTPDAKKARAILEKTCDATSKAPVGCVQLSAALEQLGETKDRGRDILAVGCRAGDRDACSVLGSDLLWAHRSGDPKDAKPIDLERGIFFLERACKLRADKSCTSAGLELVRGVDFDGKELLRKDPPRGLVLLERGCQLGEEFACSTFARELVDGKQVPRDPKRAADAFAGLCARGNGPACAEHALLQLEGDGVAKDPGRARIELERRCLDSRLPIACYGFGRLLQAGEGGVARDPARALEYFVEFAATKDAAARALTLLEAAPAAKRNPARIASLEAYVCVSETNRDPAPCRRTAAYRERERKPSEALPFFRQACQLDPKDRASCKKARALRK